MNNDLQKKLLKILVVTDWLIQEFETPCTTPTKLGKELIQEAEDYKEKLLNVLDKFYNNQSLIKSDILQVLGNKFDYIINKELK